MSRDRGSDADRVPVPERTETTVSALTVPFLLGGLLLGFGSGYLLGPWAGILVLIVVIAMLVMAARDRSRWEPAVAGTLGTILGYGGVMLMAVVYYIA